MKVSLRTFLLINLLLTIVATTALTAIGNYYLDTKDIETQLDVLLSQANFNFQALLGSDLHPRDFAHLQQDLNNIPKLQYELSTTINTPHALRRQPQYQFQVWNTKKEIVLHSLHAPSSLLSDGTLGFDTVTFQGHDWRIFTSYNKNLRLFITIAENYNMRRILAARITQDDIYIMLVTYPIAAILIWIIVGYGLRSIYRVTDEVAHRVPTYLDPVDAGNVPPEIKPLVFELNKLFLRLHQAIEREKRFAGDAAHELRTPLAALKTQAQVALQAESIQECKNLLKNVIAGVDRCTHVVQQLLTLSRLVPESNTISDKTHINLPKLAAEIVAQLVPLAINKNIDIELYTQHENIIIEGNITALSILIRNLVDNAIRYTPDGGEIKINIVNLEHKISLQVTDNGPGIPAELRTRVFERFFRVLGNKSPGSGLGLAIVQQIATLHQAQLKLGPPPDGKGLEVEVLFNT